MEEKKKVLYIGPDYFNYDNYILDELRKRYKVTYINSAKLRRKYVFLYFILWHFRLRKFIDVFNKKYLTYKINHAPSDIDVVFIIKASNFTTQHVNLLKKKYPKASQKVYLWDDYKRIDNKEVIELFAPYIYSFDPIDCDNFGFIFRPLFYVSNHLGKKEKDYCVSFIGSNHSDRFEWLLKFKKICQRKGFSYFIKIRLTYGMYIKTLFLKSMEYHKDSDLFFTGSIPYKKFIDVTSRSRAVVDFPFIGQNGLTMRAIETMALGVKLLTTAKSIRLHKDIPSDLYYVIDENFSESDFVDFLSKDNKESRLPDRYSLQSFIKDIVG